MFNTEFTFGNSVSIGKDGSAHSISQKQINRINNENKKLKPFFKKNIVIKFNKSIQLYKKSIGLGDIVDFITKITGIKKLIIKLTKGNCGCEKRRKLFNSWLTIPYIVVSFGDVYKEDFYFFNEHNMPLNNKFKITPPDQSKPIKKSCGCANKNKGANNGNKSNKTDNR